jgi:hypothetical protein
MQATVTWTANPAGDNVTAYRLYYGDASGVYNGANSPLSMGLSLIYNFNQSTSGKVYFAMTAVNAVGESAFSAEASKTPGAGAMVNHLRNLGVYQ